MENLDGASQLLHIKQFRSCLIHNFLTVKVALSSSKSNKNIRCDTASFVQSLVE